MAEGYVSVVPPQEFSDYAILKTFYDGELVPSADEELRVFLHDKGVGAIVVQDGLPGPWAKLFGVIDAAPQAVGGVILYRVPDEVRLGSAGGSSGGG
jgi:hypothetical protein